MAINMFLAFALSCKTRLIYVIFLPKLATLRFAFLQEMIYKFGKK